MSAVPEPILPFRPAPAVAGVPPVPALPTLGTVIAAYLAHLALKLELGQLTAAHHANVTRSLTRFADAWRVVWGDGRQAMLQAERVRSPQDALTQAMALHGRPAGAPLAGLPSHANRNRDWPLHQASSDDLTRWVLANPQWKTGWTKTNNLVALVAAFHWYEEETGTRAPYRRSRMPVFEKASRREAEATEYVALMKHTSSVQLRRALWCLWNVQGMRTCELRELVWTDFRCGERSLPGDADFDWQAAYIAIEKHKARRKTGKPKLIALTRRQARFFAALWRQRPPDTCHVFVNTEGGAWDRHTFARHLRRTAKRIGLDEGVVDRITAYCLRHSFATQCDEAGVDDAKTARLMGHSSPDMVRRVYSKIGRKVEPMRAAAEAAEAARRQTRRAARKRKGTKPGKPPTEYYPELFD